MEEENLACDNTYACPARYKCYGNRCLCNSALLFTGDGCHQTEPIAFCLLGLSLLVAATSFIKIFKVCRRQYKQNKRMVSTHSMNSRSITRKGACGPCGWLLVSSIFILVRASTSFIRLFHIPERAEKFWFDYCIASIFFFQVGFTVLALFHAGIFCDTISPNKRTTIMPRWLQRRKKHLIAVLILGSCSVAPISLIAIQANLAIEVLRITLPLLTLTVIYLFVAAGFRLQKQLKSSACYGASKEFRGKMQTISQWTRKTASWMVIYFLVVTGYSVFDASNLLPRPGLTILILVELSAFCTLAEIVAGFLGSQQLTPSLLTSIFYLCFHLVRSFVVAAGLFLKRSVCCVRRLGRQSMGTIVADNFPMHTIEKRHRKEEIAGKPSMKKTQTYSKHCWQPSLFFNNNRTRTPQIPPKPRKRWVLRAEPKLNVELHDQPDKRRRGETYNKRKTSAHMSSDRACWIAVFEDF